MSHWTSVEKTVLLSLTSIALLMFFLPLIVIQAPIVGEQEVSGYDVFSKIRQFSNQVDKSSESSQSSASASTREPNAQPSATPRAKGVNESEMPISLRLAWLIPIDVTVAFILAAVTFVGAGGRVQVSSISAMAGAALSLLGLLHVTIANSDLHTWLASSFKASSEELKGNPFAGIAEQFGNLMLNAFKIKPGAGLYVLAAAMVISAVLTKTRILSKYRVEPITRSASVGN